MLASRRESFLFFFYVFSPLLDLSLSLSLPQMQDAVHELEGIDLADPDLHKAATKIQASFRGHKVRQEVSMHCTADESKK